MSVATIPQTPYLKPWWRITREAARMTFHYGDDAILCEGKAAAVLPRVLPLLDGHHTVDDIVAELGPNTRGFVDNVLTMFAGKGMIIEGPPVADDVPADQRNALHFVAATQPWPTSLSDDGAKLGTLRVGIAGNSDTAAEIARVLRRIGTAAETIGWNAPGEQLERVDVVIVAPSAAELPELTAWNALALAARTTWLQVLPFDGRFAAIGPLYIAGETGCYECFQHRRAANIPYSDQYWAMQSTPAPYPSALPVDVTLAGLVSLFLLRWQLRADANLPGAFHALEINGEVAITSHVVYRVPRCKACSTVEQVAPVLPWFEESGT